MTIQFNRETFKFVVMLGCLVYSEHDSRTDAERDVRDYYRFKKVGRA